LNGQSDNLNYQTILTNRQFCPTNNLY